MMDIMNSILKIDANKIALVIMAYVIFVFMGEIREDRIERRSLQKQNTEMNRTLINHLDSVNNNIDENTRAIREITDRLQTVEKSLIKTGNF